MPSENLQSEPAAFVAFRHITANSTIGIQCGISTPICPRRQSTTESRSRLYSHFLEPFKNLSLRPPRFEARSSNLSFVKAEATTPVLSPPSVGIDLSKAFAKEVSRRRDNGKKYCVLLFNDDYNKREHVVQSLLKVVNGLDLSSALAIMLQAHNNGMAVRAFLNLTFLQRTTF